MATCASCSVALTFHKRARRGRPLPLLRLRGAARRAVRASATPSALELEGLGTEKLEETLGAAFPMARVARLDRDVASGTRIESDPRAGARREIDILVGTQMVTKGHDLPSVTLVGVINADAALSIPDFRGERAQRSSCSCRWPGAPAAATSPGACSCRRGIPSTRPSRSPPATTSTRSSSESSPTGGSSATRRSRGARSCASTRSTRPRRARRCARLAAVARQCEARCARRGAGAGARAGAHRARAKPLPLPGHAPRGGARAAARGALGDRRGPRDADAGRPRGDRRGSGAAAMTEPRAMKARAEWHIGEGPSLSTRVETDRLVLRPPRTADVPGDAPRPPAERGPPAALERRAGRGRRRGVAHLGLARGAAPPARVEAGAGVRAPHHATARRADHHRANRARRRAPRGVPERVPRATGSTWRARGGG